MRSLVSLGASVLLVAACGPVLPSTDADVQANDITQAHDATDVTPSTDAAPDGVTDAATEAATDADADADTTMTDGGCAIPTGGEDDPLLAMRTGCHFAAGARVADTLGVTACARARIPITHIVVLIQENRSFDHYLGAMGLPDVDGFPASYANPITATTVAHPSHANTTCISPDVGHGWTAVHNQWNNGQMDGFYANAATSGNGQRAMFYYTAADLPFYHWMYGTFATSDRYFCSAIGPTWPNRQYMYTGTSQGNMETGGTTDTATSIFDRLTAAHVTWGVYADGSPLEDCLGWNATHANFHGSALFRTQASDGTLPQVSFIDGRIDGQWEHPPADVSPVEGWVRQIYMSVVGGANWPHTAFFITYDEGGGFFDHVPPPAACVPDSAARNAAFNRLGIRVPIAVVSPYARPHYVSHQTHSHTSVTRFIETVFDLPALTNRDANSDAMMDLFDFSTPALMSPGAPPASGASRCGG